MAPVKRKAKGSRYERLSTYKYIREPNKMPKHKSYKKLMSELIKKKNTTLNKKDMDNIQKNVGGGKSKQVEQI